LLWADIWFWLQILPVAALRFAILYSDWHTNFQTGILTFRLAYSLFKDSYRSTDLVTYQSLVIILVVLSLSLFLFPHFFFRMLNFSLPPSTTLFYSRVLWFLWLYNLFTDGKLVLLAIPILFYGFLFTEKSFREFFMTRTR
jgi:hypothetical protein